MSVIAMLRQLTGSNVDGQFRIIYLLCMVPRPMALSQKCSVALSQEKYV